MSRLRNSEIPTPATPVNAHHGTPRGFSRLRAERRGRAAECLPGLALRAFRPRGRRGWDLRIQSLIARYLRRHLPYTEVPS